MDGEGYSHITNVPRDLTLIDGWFYKENQEVRYRRYAFQTALVRFTALHRSNYNPC